MKPCSSVKISIHFVFCLVCCGSTLQANTLCKYKIEKFKTETTTDFAFLKNNNLLIGVSLL